MTTEIFKNLNANQRRAVEHMDGPLLIIAGPGSGKTRVIVHRAAHIISTHGVPPPQTCVVTFTNRAARELRHRLSLLLGSYVSTQISAGTFHSLCAQILRRDGNSIGIDRNFTIYDKDDQISLVKRAMERSNVNPKQFPPMAVLNTISGAKAQLVDSQVFAARVNSYFEQVVSQIYQQYQFLLSESQAVDFDDLLLRTHTLFDSYPDILDRYQYRFMHLLVDEFQDTNMAQYQLSRQLSAHWRNICAVGDPDQSIYGWRHADIRNILSFRNDFPDATTILLEENYRSTATILEAAQKVISINQNRFDKRLVTNNPIGEPVEIHEAYDERDEATWVMDQIELLKSSKIRYNDCCVAYRVNAQSRALEEACIRRGIPYRLVGALRFYQRKEVKDAIAYLRIIQNKTDTISLTRIINVPPRGIGQRTVQRLVDSAGHSSIPLRETISDLVRSSQFPNSKLNHQDNAVVKFGQILDELKVASKTLDVRALLSLVIEKTGYKEHLLEDPVLGEDRWQNIGELLGVASEFADLPPEDGLATFLTQEALSSDVDRRNQTGESEENALTLITLHLAKGLEFPVVFIVGMEEGLLPHGRSFDDPDEMEEERRLCYVGITRAKYKLYLVRAFRRTLFGRSSVGLPSRFLHGLPQNLISADSVEVPRDSEIVTSPVVVRPSPLRVGQKVLHKTFGEGVVVSSSEISGDYQIVVAFKQGGLKKLLHSFAPLELIQDDADISPSE